MFKHLSRVAYDLNEVALEIRNRGVVFIIFGLATIFCMWGFNLLGWFAANAVLFILATITGFLFAASPRGVSILAASGFVVNGLNDGDMSQGAIKGVVWLFKAAVALAWGFWIGTWVLLMIPFYFNPGSYWIFLAMIMGFTYAWVTFGGGSGMAYKLSMILMVIGVLHTILMVFPPYQNWWKGSMGGWIRASEAALQEQERGITIHRDFILTVPAGDFSEAINNASGKCLIRRPADGQASRMPPAIVWNNDTDWQPYEVGKPFAKIAYDGRQLSRPYKIQVQVRDRGQCKSW